MNIELSCGHDEHDVTEDGAINDELEPIEGAMPSAPVACWALRFLGNDNFATVITLVKVFGMLN